MTLPSSGPLSMNDIAGEFGGSTPHALNEYYAGGGLVPAGTSGTYGAVPSSGTISIQNFYGTSNFVPIYIEEVFSTWLYTGTGATQTITNGINLSTNGGLVWLKERSSTGNNPAHWLFDTNRGTNASLSSNSTANEIVWGGSPTGIAPISTTGFSVTNIQFNTASSTYVSWTFRKQPKFFDVVTYTGTGANRTVAHNLGSVPGCIILKSTNDSFPWVVYHRSLGATKYLILNSTMAQDTAPSVWNNTDPTSTTFTVGTNGATNQPGVTYVAYLFAHNAGGFGLTGTDNVVSCGSFTAGGVVSLGYEPQWVMTKKTDGAGSWDMVDTMRGFVAPPGTTTRYLDANASNAEASWGGVYGPTATGFDTSTLPAGDYIYIAIRRGPMKTPTSGTSVFSPNTWTSGTGSSITTNFPVDMQIGRWMGSGDNNLVQTRLPGVNTTTTNSSQPRLITNSTAGEVVEANNNYGYNNTGFLVGGNYGGDGWAVNFRRAPGFFDVVCYTGTGVNRTVNHNLGVVPEMMIVKARSAATSWFVYTASTGNQGYTILQTADPFYNPGSFNPWNSTTPTASVFSLYGTGWNVNDSGATYVAYLFASCPGVSKVGSYTGTGALQTINCGFTGGARFVLIKRTDTSGGWWLYDSARGISSGNDPYLLLNTVAAQITNTNYLDTASTGFQLTTASGAVAELNASGGTYIFLAIA